MVTGFQTQIGGLEDIRGQETALTLASSRKNHRCELMSEFSFHNSSSLGDAFCPSKENDVASFEESVDARTEDPARDSPPETEACITKPSKRQPHKKDDQEAEADLKE